MSGEFATTQAQLPLSVDQLKRVRALVQRGLTRRDCAAVLDVEVARIPVEVVRKARAERKAMSLDDVHKRAFGSDADSRLTLWWLENIERISAPAKKSRLKIDQTLHDSSGKSLRSLSDEELWKLLQIEQQKSSAS